MLQSRESTSGRHLERVDASGDAHHGQGVEQVGTQHVARARSCSFLRIAMRDDASSGRGPHRDYGQANHQIADAKALGDGHRPHTSRREAPISSTRPTMSQRMALLRHALGDDVLLGIRIQRIPLPFMPAQMDQPISTANTAPEWRHPSGPDCRR